MGKLDKVELVDHLSLATVTRSDERNKIFNSFFIKEAGDLYDDINMADIILKRHFDPKLPNYVMNKLIIHSLLEIFCERV